MSKFLGESWLKVLVGHIFLAKVFPGQIIEQWFLKFGKHHHQCSLLKLILEDTDPFSECVVPMQSLTMCIFTSSLVMPMLLVGDHIVDTGLLTPTTAPPASRATLTLLCRLRAWTRRSRPRWKEGLGQRCLPDISPLGVVYRWAGPWFLPWRGPSPSAASQHKAPFTGTASARMCSCSGGLVNPVKKTNSSLALGWRALPGTEAGFFSRAGGQRRKARG